MMFDHSELSPKLGPNGRRPLLSLSIVFPIRGGSTPLRRAGDQLDRLETHKSLVGNAW